MKGWSKIFLMLLFVCIRVTFAMEPAVTPLSPLDKVFLNACKNNKPLEVILKMNPNINAVDSEEMGYSGLHYVCMNGDIGKAQLLLDHGANINQRSKYGGTPLYVTFGASIKGIKQLSASQRYEMARFLIEHRADVWAEGANNQSILQVAAISGDVHAIKLLIEAMKRDKKKDWKTVPNVGYDALYEAIANKKEDIALLLLKEGVSVTTTAEVKDGVSLMHVACSRGNRRIIEELIKRGLNIDTPDNMGQAALHYISEHGDPKAIKLLLDLGANPQLQDKNGNTPLDLARTNPNKEVQKLLLQATKSSGKKISPQTVGITAPKVISTDISPQTKSGSAKSRRQARKELLASKKEDVVEKVPVIKIDVPQKETVPGPEVLPDIDKPEKQIPTSPREIESTSEQIQDKPHKSSESKHSLKSIGSYVRDEARDIVKSVTEKAKSLTERVEDWTEKPIKNVTPVSLTKTYASMVGNQAEQREAQSVTVIDDYMTIKVTIPPYMQNRFATMTQQDNPLTKITRYSNHVKEKMKGATDLYHNFSPHVEERLGFFADSEMIRKATKKHGPTIRYTVPAEITIFSEQPISGTFEFIERDGEMIHRFFKPDTKSKKKEKISFRLPLERGDSSKSLSQ